MIQVVRRSIVDIYNLYSFSRGSLAYDSKGKLYHLHNARYETGKFGKAVMVEEGTTNLASAIAYIDYAYCTYDGQVLLSTPNGQQSVAKYTVTATTGIPRGAKVGEAVAGNTYTLTAIMKKSGAGTFVVSANKPFPEGGNTINVTETLTTQDLGDGWVKVTLKVTVNSNTVSQCILTFGVSGAAVGDIFYVYWLQWEKKPYATSFIDGTRSPETLTIPTAGVLNPQEGTVEQYIKLLRSPGTNEQFIFDGAGPANQNLQVAVRTDGKVDVRYGTGSATVIITGTTVLAKDTWYAIAWRWSSAGVALLINGTVEASSATTPSLSFGTNAYLACKADGTCQFDGLLDDLRISPRARTDAEIAAAYQSGQPLPVDADTTLKLDFDGPDTQRAAKVLVV